VSYAKTSTSRRDHRVARCQPRTRVLHRCQLPLTAALGAWLTRCAVPARELAYGAALTRFLRAGESRSSGYQAPPPPRQGDTVNAARPRRHIGEYDHRAPQGSDGPVGRSASGIAEGLSGQASPWGRGQLKAILVSARPSCESPLRSGTMALVRDAPARQEPTAATIAVMHTCRAGGRVTTLTPPRARTHSLAEGRVTGPASATIAHQTRR
jgi:hypothetical protein